MTGPLTNKRCKLLASIALLAALFALSSCERDRRADHASFGTPEEATAAFIAALDTHDPAKLQRLLGPGTETLLSSGDDVADRLARTAFLRKYRARDQFVAGGADDLVLHVGEDAWPLPIPLVRRAGRWQFDGAAGADELILRRIGRNELRTIDVMQGFVVAQQEYFATAHDDVPAGVYAQRLRSDPGKHNGLYWEVGPGEPPSPAGPLLAAADADAGDAPHAPYHGYLYRLLFAQAPAANDGARDYRTNDLLTRGFALLAAPDTYDVSGIMTFMVNQDGIIWQRDLGADTARLVAQIEHFNPDATWSPIPPEH